MDGTISYLEIVQPDSFQKNPKVLIWRPRRGRYDDSGALFPQPHPPPPVTGRQGRHLTVPTHMPFNDMCLAPDNLLLDWLTQVLIAGRQGRHLKVPAHRPFKNTCLAPDDLLNCLTQVPIACRRWHHMMVTAHRPLNNSCLAPNDLPDCLTQVLIAGRQWHHLIVPANGLSTIQCLTPDSLLDCLTPRQHSAARTHAFGYLLG